MRAIDAQIGIDLAVLRELNPDLAHGCDGCGPGCGGRLGTSNEGSVLEARAGGHSGQFEEWVDALGEKLACQNMYGEYEDHRDNALEQEQLARECGFLDFECVLRHQLKAFEEHLAAKDAFDVWAANCAPNT